MFIYLLHQIPKIGILIHGTLLHNYIIDNFRNCRLASPDSPVLVSLDTNSYKTAVIYSKTQQEKIRYENRTWVCLAPFVLVNLMLFSWTEYIFHTHLYISINYKQTHLLHNLTKIGKCKYRIIMKAAVWCCVCMWGFFCRQNEMKHYQIFSILLSPQRSIFSYHLNRKIQHIKKKSKSALGNNHTSQ